MKEFLCDLNYDNLIQNISGIGAFITSVITLFTLYVLIKQRKDSFRPRVIFGHRVSAKCIIDDDYDKNWLFKTKWVDAYPKKKEKNVDFCFDVLNVGEGIAENVRIKESFNVNKAIRFIKKIDLKNEFVFVDNKDLFEVRTTFDESYIYTQIDTEARELGTFVSRHQKKPSKYIFTDSYLAFLACFDYLRNKYGHYLSLDGFPKCNFEISYEDMEGTKYKSKYYCKVTSVLLDDYTFTFIKK